MKILVFFGTRPEAIKLAPLVKELLKFSDKFNVRVCVSAQHREMLDQVLNFFEIKPHYDLNIMKHRQDLFDITVNILGRIKEVIAEFQPDWIIVQGDTTTTFVGALAAFYRRTRIAHVEAGLRSFNKYAPFPEEINRVLTSHLADVHFAPTNLSKKNLLNEGIPQEKIVVVGNTSIDALFYCLKIISDEDIEKSDVLRKIDFCKKIILVTGHRRENFGEPFKEMCMALREIATYEDVEIVYPVHLNPNVRKPVFDILGGLQNVHLIEPLDYPYFVWLMSKSYIILTDSGGVQEEAPSLGKPVLVMREVTERNEGVIAGTAVVVGTNKKAIVNSTVNLLHNKAEYELMAKSVNPYGDGKASIRIRQYFEKEAERGRS